MFSILRNVPGLVFNRHFISLFAEFGNREISNAILDLLYVFGSGCTTSTVTDSSTPTSDESNLCRSSQLLICVALVMTRQVLYDFNLQKKTLSFLTMQQFEDLLD